MTFEIRDKKSLISWVWGGENSASRELSVEQRETGNETGPGMNTGMKGCRKLKLEALEAENSVVQDT